MTDPSSSRPPFQRTTPGPLASGGPTGTPLDPPAAKLDAIIADLGSRGVNGEPVVVTSESVTWPDGSLGCATPGQTYTQALVDGMRIVVEVGGTSYDYRFGTGDEPHLCEGFIPGALRSGGLGGRTV